MGVLDRDVLSNATHGSHLPSSWGTLDEDDPRAWKDRAACLGAPLAMFFPSKGGSLAEAKRICASCPVVLDCRRACDKAERDQPPSHLFGYFAGETPRERTRRRGEG